MRVWTQPFHEAIWRARSAIANASWERECTLEHQRHFLNGSQYLTLKCSWDGQSLSTLYIMNARCLRSSALTCILMTQVQVMLMRCYLCDNDWRQVFEVLDVRQEWISKRGVGFWGKLVERRLDLHLHRLGCEVTRFHVLLQLQELIRNLPRIHLQGRTKFIKEAPFKKSISIHS